MKKLNLVLSLALIVGCSTAYADILGSTVPNSTPAITTPFAETPGVFWNNMSSDTVGSSHAVNVANFLNQDGAFTGAVANTNCPTCGTNYISGGSMYVDTTATNTPDYVSGLNFVRQAGALSISLLYANSGANGFAEFGIYDASSQANAVNNHLILQGGLGTGPGYTGGNLNTPAAWTSGTTSAAYTSGTLFMGATNDGTFSLANGSPFATWGLYVRTCEEGSVSFAQCNADGKIVTFYMGEPSQETAQFANDAAHQHFALFQAGSNVNQYYAGLEDWAFNASDPNAGTNGVEGYGDYNDLIFGITSSISAAPEPATLSIMGLGLAGLGMLGRRKLKK